MKLTYTKHAKKKFKILTQVGIEISRKSIREAIKIPEHIDEKSDYPKKIVSVSTDETHVLRVVYKAEGDIIIVITFYLAKRGRYYEKKTTKN